MTGYRGEGWLEEAESFTGPDILEIIRMENQLGLAHIDEGKIAANDKAWAYYRELKAKVEDKRRKSA